MNITKGRESNSFNATFRFMQRLEKNALGFIIGLRPWTINGKRLRVAKVTTRQLGSDSNPLREDYGQSRYHRATASLVPDTNTIGFGREALCDILTERQSPDTSGFGIGFWKSKTGFGYGRDQHPIGKYHIVKILQEENNQENGIKTFRMKLYINFYANNSIFR